MIVGALVWIAAAGLAGIGAAALFSPFALARAYGIPVRDASAAAFVRAAGARDLLIAGILAFAHLRGDGPVVAAVCAAGALLALTDLLLAVRSARRFPREAFAHVAGFAGFAVLTLLTMRH